jgi:hypothetical protein
MPLPNAKKVYVVQEMNWEYNDEYHSPVGEGQPVMAFRDRNRAEAYRHELEQAPRVQDCLSYLFIYAGAYQFEDPLARLTSLSEAALLERIGAATLPVPKEPSCTWQQWYELNWGGLEPAERHRLYDLFDRARFYQIVEMDLES